MKRKNISADTALLEVARRHNTTVDAVSYTHLTLPTKLEV